MRRLLLGAAVFAVSLVIGILGSTAWSEGNTAGTQPHETPSFADGSATYLLSHFVIQFPYTDPKAELVGEPQEALLAKVMYTATWATGEYPGEGSCTIVLSDAAGEVGVKDFAYDSEESVSSSVYAIVVDREPDRATGYCGPPAIKTDVDGHGYVFDNIDVRPTDEANGTEITADVSWEEAAPPGMRKCVADITLASGSVETIHFGIYYGTSPVEFRLLPSAAVYEITEVAISCAVPKA